MGFPKAVQNTIARELLDRYDEAKKQYSVEQKKLYYLRVLADHPNASDEAIVKYARARKEFSSVAKQYQAIRNEFLITVQQLQKEKQFSDQSKDSEVFNTLNEMTLTQEKKLRQDAVIEEELNSGKNKAILSAAKQYMAEAEAKKLQGQNESDPTLGDFEPLP